ncbi:hypothetical protein HCN44_006028 [Aphidius gifuensis]|uniref:Odorant-binding protein n=1 Tax=Aphidius gifuensis TaxID=684658 RepID=A0A835CVH3_APHGI|nr:hypothetical protein HCN44_006028 [Aphidius gifuensis]
MTSKGVIVKEKAIEMVPTDMKNREKLIDAIETCSGEYGADECETVRKVRFCILAKVIYAQSLHGSVVLDGDSWLVYWLDRALRHGLRVERHGYWGTVRELSH